MSLLAMAIAIVVSTSGLLCVSSVSLGLQALLVVLLLLRGIVVHALLAIRGLSRLGSVPIAFEFLRNYQGARLGRNFAGLIGAVVVGNDALAESRRLLDTAEAWKW